MGKKGLLLGAFFLLSLITQFTVYAETVTLKSGSKIEGKITEKTDQYIKIEVAGVPVTYFLDEIQKIDAEPANAQATPDLTQPTNTTTADNAIAPKSPEDEYAELDKGTADYAAISSSLRNFVEHNNDRDPTQCMLSVSKNFKTMANKSSDTVAGYDYLMQEQKDRTKNIESAVVKDFKINKITVRGDLAKSTVSFKLSIEKTGGEKVNKQPVWFFRTAKEPEGWKITEFLQNPRYSEPMPTSP